MFPISRCWREAISKIRQCDNYIDIKQIIEEAADEQIEKNQLIYQLLDKLMLPSPEKKKSF